jgi:DNA-3-methyladenine glycosylase II
MKIPSSFDAETLVVYCDRLAQKDPVFKTVINTYGYPPCWTRKAHFETLIHIILEQQVSLASAKAALLKLKERVGLVTPSKIMSLSDEALKACYFSRQKIQYARHLSEAVLSKKISISALTYMRDDEVRASLTAIKGIGNWTADVYLMMVLHRNDLFPLGDIALLNSVKHLKGLPAHTAKEAIGEIAENWKPYRTAAAFLCWHAYLQRKNLPSASGKL